MFDEAEIEVNHVYFLSWHVKTYLIHARNTNIADIIY